jgi:type IV pilus assembly protein PilB
VILKNDMKSEFFKDISAIQLFGKSKNIDLDNIDKLVANSEKTARTLVPFEQAEILEVLPIGLKSDNYQKTLLVAVKKGNTQNVTQILQFCTNCKIKTFEIDEKLIKIAIFKAYKQESDYLTKSIDRLSLIEESKPNTLSKAILDTNKGEIGDFLEALIEYAIANNVSDIHITPLLNGSYIRVRKNGEILEHEKVVGSTTAHTQLVNRVKVLAGIPNIKLSEPIDGKFEAGSKAIKVEVRVSILPSLHGENIVLRLHTSVNERSLNELGLSQNYIEEILKMLNLPEGLFIFAGPTGSGKTTALYALIAELQKRSLIINTIEDPVERKLEGLVQTELNKEQDLTYAKCLKAVLRQDPDAIIVGELRDEQSASLILQAAITGHLVATSVHARSVLDVFKRFENFGIKAIDLLQATRTISAFKLLPKLCQKCKVIDLHTSSIAGYEIYKSVGCSECDYSFTNGLVLIAETLIIPNNYQVKGENINQEQLSKIGEYVSFKEELKKALKNGLISWADARAYLC